MATKETVQQSLSRALTHLEEASASFWHGDKYKNYFKAGILHSEKVCEVAEVLKTKPQGHLSLLGEMQSVLQEYEEKNFWGKLWFRMWEPHPIDFYYHLCEISSLQLLNDKMEEHASFGAWLVSQASLSYVLKNIRIFGFVDSLIQGWRNMLYAEELHKKKPQATLNVQSNDCIPEEKVRETLNQYYLAFKEDSVSFIYAAVETAAHHQTFDSVTVAQLKCDTNEKREKQFEAINEKFPDDKLSENSKQDKKRCFKAIARWEEFAFKCYDGLYKSSQSSHGIKQELEIKAARVPVGWREEIEQGFMNVKKTLTQVFEDIHIGVKQKLNQWVQVQTSGADYLKILCNKLSSKTLNDPSTIDAVLGASYLSCQKKEKIEATFSEKAKGFEQTATEKTVVIYNTLPGEEEKRQKITLAIENNPEKIPQLLISLNLLFEKTKDPQKRVEIFGDIALWQQRYLEAILWHYVSFEEDILTFAEKQKQEFVKIYHNLAQNIHPDHSNIPEQESMTQLIQQVNVIKDNYDASVGKLIGDVNGRKISSYRDEEEPEWLQTLCLSAATLEKRVERIAHELRESQHYIEEQIFVNEQRLVKQETEIAKQQGEIAKQKAEIAEQKAEITVLQQESQATKLALSAQEAKFAARDLELQQFQATMKQVLMMMGANQPEAGSQPTASVPGFF